MPPGVKARGWASLFNVDSNDNRRLGTLSRGSRQLFGLRVALAGTNADVIILDEPWEGLDPAGSAWLTDVLRRWRDAGAALLISSHRLHDLDSVCTRFVLLQGGRCHSISDRDQRPRVEQIAHAVGRVGQ